MSLDPFSWAVSISGPCVTMDPFFHLGHCAGVCSKAGWPQGPPCVSPATLKRGGWHWNTNVRQLDQPAWGQAWKALPEAGHILEALHAKNLQHLCGHFMHYSRIWDAVSQSCSRSWQAGATWAEQWFSTFRCTKFGAWSWIKMSFSFVHTRHLSVCEASHFVQGLVWEETCSDGSPKCCWHPEKINKLKERPEIIYPVPTHILVMSS